VSTYIAEPGLPGRRDLPFPVGELLSVFLVELRKRVLKLSGQPAGQRSGRAEPRGYTRALTKVVN